MYRSFTDRVLGGVCGGLGAILPVSPWIFRFAFIILAIVTAGAFALLYLVLWWALPQESLIEGRRGGGGRLLLVIILALATLVGWVAHSAGALRGPTGQGLFWPAMLLVLSVIYFLRQIGGRRRA